MNTQEGEFEFIAWSEKYGVCDGKLDADHKQFVDLFNKLSDAVNEDNATDELISAVYEELTEHMDKHFKAEEVFMEKHGYPSLKQHKVEHEQFRRNVLLLAEEFGRVGVKAAHKLTHFLKTWLLDHMNGSDKDYADYIKNKGFSSDIHDD